MPPFEDTIQHHCDNRIGTLARIKSRSFGADVLTLSALRVLVYAQLEGGVKDLASCLIKHINVRRLHFSEIRPNLLQWRNRQDIETFQAMVNFDNIALPSPFAAMLTRRVQIRSINRKYEMNQMDWSSIKGIYKGLGLDHAQVEGSKAEIDEIVSDRNATAHYGAMPSIAASLAEKHLRSNVAVVENVLTDLSLQMLDFFDSGKHRRLQPTP